MDHEAAFDRLMDHVHCPYHRGSCLQPTHTAEMQIPSCGDRLRMQLRIEDGHVKEAWFTGTGCCISQAAASMLVEHAEGRSRGELQNVTAEAMLVLVGVPLSPRRRACALLAWHVLRAALQ